MKSIKACLFIALSSLELAGSAGAQVTIRGIVRSTEGHAIISAEIRDRASGLRAMSDSLGAFSLSDVPDGDRILDVRRIGFTAESFPIALVFGHDRRVALQLTRIVQALPDERVHGVLDKPARYADTRRYDEFYSRRAMGFGTFLTREDIDRQFKTNTPELLQGMAGMKVKRIGNEWKVQSMQCQLGIPSLADPSESIRVFINGRDVGDASELTTVNPAEIEAMEVYKGPGELPAEARGKGCAAIFIWTRVGN